MLKSAKGKGKENGKESASHEHAVILLTPHPRRKAKEIQAAHLEEQLPWRWERLDGDYTMEGASNRRVEWKHTITREVDDKAVRRGELISVRFPRLVIHSTSEFVPYSISTRPCRTPPIVPAPDHFRLLSGGIDAWPSGTANRTQSEEAVLHGWHTQFQAHACVPPSVIRVNLVECLPSSVRRNYDDDESGLAVVDEIVPVCQPRM
ncbi:hypothetical protein OE88DRAFT_1362630 [Heliocybe sulcata]|uniref:Uncharacterized protein n=1 Tax=Heliocybe sulcata TaxID=5364 RepID=A0A5C3N4E6_9AGAM|nr:hypothetical protein OE88DRAFT_1362630 [Heliocybe sulcata]